ncbi:dTDP-4-dehydrorhamnose 3,5-epimerase [Candidatus Uhrbacteria bacterium]|nr:dTDP-4-dehydrorhamnose 3,5-epimerase [Candidatus Uhrbacteria bacterium]
MNVTPTPIQGLLVVEPQVFSDDRGFFYEVWNADKFAALGLPSEFPQDNHSYSVKGVLRGLHFQLPPKPMGKLVRCTRGKVWDVAVDLRKASPTYMRHFAIELSAENKKMLWMPAGFAHGFYALEECEVLYKCTHTYDKAGDGNVAWNDPELNVPWPLAGEPTLSPRDQAAPKLAELDLPF